ncbi:bifunctional heptose 7-phosphate kinase/heptose 1-phosphate adenyltransferase, partial [Singulisphaera rosea]
GIDHFAVIEDGGRPTTVKERLMGRAQHRHAHQILRIDREVRIPPSPRAAEKLTRRLMGLVDDHDVVLISDYAKGVCGPLLLSDLILRARVQGIPVLVDPARGVDYDRYRGSTCLTPNRREAQEAVGMTIGSPEEALAAGSELRERFGLDAAIVTLDRDGMALVYAEGEAAIYPTRPRQVYDITGAGDMVLAVLGIVLAEGASFDQAVRLANVAGGLEVERVGVTPVTWNEILAELEPTRLRGPAHFVVHLQLQDEAPALAAYEARSFNRASAPARDEAGF